MDDHDELEMTLTMIERMRRRNERPHGNDLYARLLRVEQAIEEVLALYAVEAEAE